MSKILIENGRVFLDTNNKLLAYNGSLIDPSGATITPSVILDSYKGIDANGELITGNIPSVNVATPSISETTSGFYPQYKVLTPTITQSAGYTSGGTVTGTAIYALINEGGTKTPTTSDTTLLSSGLKYLSTNLIMAGDANLTAANIKNGITIFGVTGTLTGSSYTQIYSGTQTVNTTSTTATSITTISLGSSYYTSDKIIYVKIRDKAGPKNSYFTGSDAFFFNPYKKNGQTTDARKTIFVTYRSSSGNYGTQVGTGTGGYGVYAYSLNSSGQLAIYSRYNSTYSLTINGTYDIKVYTLDYAPAQGNPYNYSSFT